MGEGSICAKRVDAREMFSPGTQVRYIVSADRSKNPKPEGLVPVESRFLQVGEELNFPIYQMTNGRDQYVLLLNRHQRVTDEIRAAIKPSSGSSIYTKRCHLIDYENYLESRVSAILSDESIPLEKRSEVLYGQASRVMEGLFEGEINKESLEKAAGYASHLSGFLNSHPQSLRSMMAMTIKDYYTFTHSFHVCIYGLGLFQPVYLEDDCPSVENVAVGLIVHDIGKTRVPDAILKKEGPLDPDEWRVIKRHPFDGRDILVANDIRDTTVLQITLSHHEKLNGTGYPQGLKGEKIAVLAQIACIADIFDAMTTHRVYRGAKPPFKALHEMKVQNAGGVLYDKDIFESFVRMMGK